MQNTSILKHHEMVAAGQAKFCTDGQVRIRTRSYKWCYPLLIFLLAFSLRLTYVSFLQHQLSEFGDAFLFLAGASKLREFFCHAIQSGDWNLISSLGLTSPNDVLAMRSISVSDRIMADGPIFPTYLALIQWLVGISPGSLLFKAKEFQFEIISAFLDSLTCLAIFLGARLAFDRRTGYIAATLFALYPASIINTQSCYSEPFACFAIASWSCIVLAVMRLDSKVSPKRGLQFLVLGMSTGMIVLTKPLFVFLPVAFLAIFITLNLSSLPQLLRSKRALLLTLVPLLLGFALVVVPWLQFTHKITGRYVLCINRSPSFNLYLGNQLDRDGWRAYPFQPGIPLNVSDAEKQILLQASRHTVSFLSLEIRKIPRLWVGSWNEFQYTLFGIPVWLQEILHQMLLGSSALGFLLLIVRTKSWKDNSAIISLSVTIVSVHNLYVLVEPISRYAVTAVPLIAMLSGFFVTSLWTQRRRLLACLIGLALLCISLRGVHELIAASATILDGKLLYVFVALVYANIIVACFELVHIALFRPGFGNRLLSLGLGSYCMIVCGITAACVIFDPKMPEWKVTLHSPAEMIKQTIAVPEIIPTPRSSSAFVLIDMSQGDFPVPVQICFNGHRLRGFARPWWQISSSPEFIEVLSLQAQASGQSLYSCRQWWLMQIPASWIRFGAKNVVTLTTGAGSPITVFGDYTVPGSCMSCLPSLDLASWTKGYATYDHSDPRPYATISTAQSESEYLANQEWNNKDLSPDVGRQFGDYRVRLITMDALTAPVLSNPESALNVLSMPDPRVISGTDLPGMQLAKKEVVLPDQYQSVDFDLRCQLATDGKGGSALVNLEFQGMDSNGRLKRWSSPWQPTLIRTTERWSPYYLSDSIPGEIRRLHRLRACVTVSPFSADQLLLHRKSAIRGKVLIRDLTLVLKPGEQKTSNSAVHVY